jgi:NAD(P)-dependent dehydrogenase (short-subunit alcohol dehydrogenase family)
MNSPTEECSTVKGTDPKDQVAVVIGGTRGIGWAICRALCLRGVRVVTCGSSVESVREASKKAAAEGVQLDVVQADARREAELEAVIGRALRIEGHLNTVVHCAGKALHGDALETSRSDWDQCIELNLTAPFLAAKLAIPHLATTTNASLIFVSSIWAVTATRRRLAYSVAKAGLAALARNLAVDCGPDGIRVNAVAPGFIETDLLARSQREISPDANLMAKITGKHPLRRIGLPADVGELVGFLASPEAAFITGQLIVIDGGVTVQSGLADLWK